MTIPDNDPSRDPSPPPVPMGPLSRLIRFLNRRFPKTYAALSLAPRMAVAAWWLRKPLPHNGTALASAYARGEFALKEAVYLAGFALACLALVLEITRVLPADATGNFGPAVLPVHLQVQI